MKKLLGLITIVLILTMSQQLIPAGATPNSSTVNLNPSSLYDLEFYLSTINCLQRYVYCKKNVQTTTPSTDCLQWGQCSHLRTLDALNQTLYVKNLILAENPNLKTQIHNLLTEYGRDNLANLLQSYQTSDITNLINDLISALSSTTDTNVVTSAGLQLYPVDTTGTATSDTSTTAN